MAKRSFDLFVTLAALIVAAPGLVAIAIAIWLTDGRPIIFRQKRIGHGGVPFTLYKFRSMRSMGDSNTDSFNAGNTTRITFIGRFLRWAKLDELPQLWNVLRGDMALVGPRPEVEEWVAAYPERWSRIHRVRPGMTDPASIIYRHEERLLKDAIDPERVYREVILPRKLALNEQYINTQSFWRDIAIILRTVVAVLTRHTASPNLT